MAIPSIVTETNDFNQNTFFVQIENLVMSLINVNHAINSSSIDAVNLQLIRTTLFVNLFIAYQGLL